MATYKKKRKDLGPIWRSSMKVDFCSSPIFERHGRPRGRHQFIDTAISATAFPPSPQLPFLRNASAWDCSSTFTRTTSLGQRCEPSSVTYSNTSAASSSFSGMEARSTGDGRCRTSSSVIIGSMCIGSPHMLRNSTRTSSFGQMLNAICPMGCPRTSKSSTDNSEHQSVAWDDLKRNCDHVSMRLNCHGHIDMVPLLI